ncbi:unnamed protein product [Linum tenue]|uniref:GPI mannosyltransferase 1 n=1 Tax=Linum tenue TaxID=586396 RepID=A0AAV0QBA4_9ROSI|nr:unnamed protein product [Linum tenue]
MTAKAPMNLRRLLIGSAVFRLALILYGEWQDAHMEVRYTDVDYLVFSDAASLMASGSSPYKRTTYRYSPLLAFLLLPNSVLHRSWGKFIFSASDLLVGYFIYKILKQRKVAEDLCLYSVMVWLLNPFTFTIGTRGNCEPIVCAMILWILICLMNGKIIQAAVWYGLVVHFRIYPIIYSLPIILVLNPRYIQLGKKPLLVNWKSNALDRATSSHINLRPRSPVLLLPTDGGVCSIQQGNHSAVFRLVLLPSAFNLAVERYETEMGRAGLCRVVDGSSIALASVGLLARVQRPECIPSALDGELGFSFGECFRDGCVHPTAEVFSHLSADQGVRFQEWSQIPVNRDTGKVYLTICYDNGL